MSFKKQLAIALQKEKEQAMWNKILLRVVLAFLGTIDWVGIARRILEKMNGEVQEQLGVTVDLTRLDLNRLFGLVEEVLSDYCKLNLDLNKDGKVGDGLDG